MKHVLPWLALMTSGCAVTTSDRSAAGLMHGASPIPGGCEAPSSENHGRNGCYFDVAIPLGRVPAQLYWHIDEYPDERSARAAATAASAVVTAYKRTFLQTVNGTADWRAAGGTRLASVGPMPAPRARSVTARFMQGMTNPGMTTRPHLHPGPEAFYLIDGGICMETPAGIAATGKGATYWVGADTPMQLTSAPGGVRRSILVVIHPTGQPWMTAPAWTAKGACPGAH